MANRKKQTSLTSTPIGTRIRGATDKSNLTISDVVEGLLSDAEPENRADPLENSSPMTTGLMKEMMSSVRDSKNSTTEALLLEVRKDISAINDKLDKTHERFEAAERRISNIEEKTDKNSERMETAEGRISDMEDRMNNMEGMNAEIDALREALANAIAGYDIDACRARKNNVIIHGLPGTSKDPREAEKTFLDLCLNTMGLGEGWIKNVDIKDAYRFLPGKKERGPMATLCMFQ